MDSTEQNVHDSVLRDYVVVSEEYPNVDLNKHARLIKEQHIKDRLLDCENPDDHARLTKEYDNTKLENDLHFEHLPRDWYKYPHLNIRTIKKTIILNKLKEKKDIRRINAYFKNMDQAARKPRKRVRVQESRVSASTD